MIAEALAFLAGVVRFAYCCFFQSLGQGQTQRERLDKFYSAQSSVYDATRTWLLRGRVDMLRLCSAALETKLGKQSNTRLVWVDVGGGTGWNVEELDKFIPITSFEAVYVVDLCEPLLNVARERFAAKGWKNVHCVCADAGSWTSPKQAHLVTFSYSLSMIPTFFAALDTAKSYLHPKGTLAVCDFYVSERSKSIKAGDGINRHCGWLSRLFWSNWFELDHIDLHSSRRQYLEYAFDVSKSYSARNTIVPFLVEIPYYIFIGGIKAADAAPSDLLEVRQSYNLKAEHSAFRSWIYGFTWEDPQVDMKAFNCTSDDTIFCITSAGCNALHYAIAGKPKRIHCVDLNPAQGHILELKLAAIAALPHHEVWQMFGLGRHPDFPALLDGKLSPLLSSAAFEFWKSNSKAFKSSFYLRGYSGHALRLVKWTLKLCGVSEAARALADAKTLEEQQEVWDRQIKPVLLGKACRRIFESPAFMWNALGVPRNQASMLLKETTVPQYAEDTLTPVVNTTHLKTQNHHYYLTLKHRYHSPESAPLYLSKDGYEALRADDRALMKRFRIHTDSIVNALRACDEGEISIWIGMDHRYDPVCKRSGSLDQEDWSDLRLTVEALQRALKVGGRAFWRSSAINPWYADLFKAYGFTVERLSARPVGATEPIDNVNMYASFWEATK